MTADAEDRVIYSYSSHSSSYNTTDNLASCWGVLTDRLAQTLSIPVPCERLVDVGCGGGHIIKFLSETNPDVGEFVGLEPAAGMRASASTLLQGNPRARTADGRFENMPLGDASIDYLVSFFAFHWVTDVEQSVSEIARCLGSKGRADIFFTGRYTGRDFTRVTTPIFKRYLGSSGLLNSTGVRRLLTPKSTEQYFAAEFPTGLTVNNERVTIYDTLERHWSWFEARSGAHFDALSGDAKEACFAEVKDALSELDEGKGIPYTVDVIHVSVGGQDA